MMLKFHLLSVQQLFFFLLKMNATTCRTIKDDGSAVAEVSGGDHKSTGEGSSVEKEVSFDVKL